MNEILLPQSGSEPTTDVPAVNHPTTCGEEKVSVKPEMMGVGTPSN
jgi:hypothetical protein